MSDLSNVYKPKELKDLDPEARNTLKKELKKQIQASREIRAIIRAHDEANKILKEKLSDTYARLSR